MVPRDTAARFPKGTWTVNPTQGRSEYWSDLTQMWCVGSMCTADPVMFWTATKDFDGRPVEELLIEASCRYHKSFYFSTVGTGVVMEDSLDALAEALAVMRVLES